MPFYLKDLVSDRWCGYHGGYFRGTSEEFLQHLNECEKKRSNEVRKDFGHSTN
jgi:hypothetical protein